MTSGSTASHALLRAFESGLHSKVAVDSGRRVRATSSTSRLRAACCVSSSKESATEDKRAKKICIWHTFARTSSSSCWNGLKAT
eukprot:6599832-Prymnesium_polylepis.1